MSGRPPRSVSAFEKLRKVLHRFLTQLPVRFEAAKGWVELRAVVVDVDEETGRARSIKRLMEV